jgi:hypothetical protein
MKRTTLTIIGVAVLIATASLASAAECTPVSTDGAGDKCCFTNPRFSGVCQVTPGEDETCSDILAYLNNLSSTGKAYCGNTPVRGGWAQVDCEESKTVDSETPVTPAQG